MKLPSHLHKAISIALIAVVLVTIQKLTWPISWNFILNNSTYVSGVPGSEIFDSNISDTGVFSLIVIYRTFWLLLFIVGAHSIFSNLDNRERDKLFPSLGLFSLMAITISLVFTLLENKRDYPPYDVHNNLIQSMDIIWAVCIIISLIIALKSEKPKKNGEKIQKSQLIQ